MHLSTYLRLYQDCTNAEMNYFRTSRERFEKLTRVLFED